MGRSRSSRPVGVVTGSRIEARCLDVAGPFLIRCSGADASRARALAEALVEEDVRGLVSFGLAGGLDPELRPGDLLLPDVVLSGPVFSALTPSPSPEARGRPPPVTAGLDRAQAPAGEGDALPLEGVGKGGGAAGFPTSHVWRQNVAAALGAAGTSYASGALLGSDAAVTIAAAKDELRAATGALAVDMESHAVAEVADRQGLPFLVLRAVADTAGANLPRAALTAVSSDGRTDHLGLLLGLLRYPAETGDLLRLARSSRQGLRTLGGVAAVLGPDLGLR